jgi:hypothetical protein
MEALVLSGTMIATLGTALLVQRALLGAMLYAIDPKRKSKPEPR